MEDTLKQWFIREVVAHEGALMRHLSRVWPDRSEIRDIRQDAYVRVYEAAARSRPVAPKSFLFATARNLMADRARRERVVSFEPRAELDALNLLVDEISPERRASARQVHSPAERCLDLHRQGYSAALATPAGAVSDLQRDVQLLMSASFSPPISDT
jgi:DNA-directed RNA polymerase specialized sigma24 family protein